MIGEHLTLWTIRLALACYALVLFGNLTWNCCQAWTIAARWLWSIGCALLLAHIASAFQFVHAWQHSQAAAETAKQTAELIGWEFGGGVYFNYVFAALWVADASWQWIDLDGYAKRPRIISVIVHAYLFFIAVNGAIIFEDGPTRWIGLLVTGVIVLQGIRRLMSLPQQSHAVEDDEQRSTRVGGDGEPE